MEKKTGNYCLSGEDFSVNANGESVISYADYATALVKVILSGHHIKERISVLQK